MLTRTLSWSKSLYSALVEAKKVCGEPVENFSFPRFHRLIASQTDGLKERLGCEKVCFSIDVEGGHVSFQSKGRPRVIGRQGQETGAGRRNREAAKHQKQKKAIPTTRDCLFLWALTGP